MSWPSIRIVPDERIVEALQQGDDGRLAGARRADDRRGLSGLGNEGEAVQDRMTLGIGEFDPVELDAALRHRERGRAGGVALADFHVDQLVDHARVDQGALHVDLQPRQALGGLVGEQQRGDEGQYRAGRLVGVDGAQAAIGDDAGDRDAGENVGQRRHALGDRGELVGALMRPVDYPADTRRQLALHGEGLHHGDALGDFLHGADHMGVEHDRFMHDRAHPARDVDARR